MRRYANKAIAQKGTGCYISTVNANSSVLSDLWFLRSTLLHNIYCAFKHPMILVRNKWKYWQCLFRDIRSQTHLYGLWKQSNINEL